MTARDISEELVNVMMNGTNDATTHEKIKAMGERLERRIISYAIQHSIDTLKSIDVELSYSSEGTLDILDNKLSELTEAYKKLLTNDKEKERVLLPTQRRNRRNGKG